ncbi:hypothetical protein GF402_06145 [Candidatus Fermentibacteria bacterium]|nr:hypothetical protein [Candidatus Fermentibacteria bacterium]
MEDSPLVTACWAQQSGRSKFERVTCAEGVIQSHPFAGVIVVSEGLQGDGRSAGLAASIVRETFAEGVAYGVGEALQDSFAEAAERVRESKLRGCSMIAAAFLENQVWIAHTGICRAYLTNGPRSRRLTTEYNLARQMGLSPGDPGFGQRVKDATRYVGLEEAGPEILSLQLDPGQSILLATSAVWMHLDEHASIEGSDPRGVKNSLGSLLRKTRVRFRRQGGAAACVRMCPAVSPSVSSRFPLRIWLPLLVALVVAGAIILRPREEGENDDREGPESRTEEMVMPLPIREEDSEATESSTDDRAVPLRTLVLADDSLSVSPDTFLQRVVGPPDPRWEHSPSGVYFLAGDVLGVKMAERVSDLLGGTRTVPLDRIVVVREGDERLFSSWLSDQDPGDVSRTAVVVETESSVAGGAPWIRNYALFANGDQSEGSRNSCFTGDPLEGLPARRDTISYRLLVVP